MFKLKNLGVIGGEAQGELSLRKFSYLIPLGQTIQDVLKDNYFITEKNRFILNDLIEVLEPNGERIQYHLLKVIEVSLSSIKTIELKFNSFSSSTLKSGIANEIVADREEEKINVLFDNKTIKVNNDNKLYINIDGESIINKEDEEAKLKVNTNFIVDKKNIKIDNEEKITLDIDNLIDDNTIKKNDNEKISVNIDNLIDNDTIIKNENNKLEISLENGDATDILNKKKINVLYDNETIKKNNDNKLYVDSSIIAPVGTIINWCVENIPNGWLCCNGATLQISQYQNLYNVIGNKYGGATENYFGYQQQSYINYKRFNNFLIKESEYREEDLPKTYDTYDFEFNLLEAEYIEKINNISLLAFKNNENIIYVAKQVLEEDYNNIIVYNNEFNKLGEGDYTYNNNILTFESLEYERHYTNDFVYNEKIGCIKDADILIYNSKFNKQIEESGIIVNYYALQNTKKIIEEIQFYGWSDSDLSNDVYTKTITDGNVDVYNNENEIIGNGVITNLVLVYNSINYNYNVEKNFIYNIYDCIYFKNIDTNINQTLYEIDSGNLKREIGFGKLENDTTFGIVLKSYTNDFMENTIERQLIENTFYIKELSVGSLVYENVDKPTAITIQSISGNNFIGSDNLNYIKDSGKDIAAGTFALPNPTNRYIKYVENNSSSLGNNIEQELPFFEGSFNIPYYPGETQVLINPKPCFYATSNWGAGTFKGSGGAQVRGMNLKMSPSKYNSVYGGTNVNPNGIYFTCIIKY